MPVVDGISHEVTGAGPAILLLAPSGYDRRIWSAVAEILSDRFTCVQFDPRGVGRSPRRDEPADRSADAHSVLVDAGISSCAVVGLGVGAAVALALALDHPGIVTMAILFEPSVPEYLDPRHSRYLGDVIERGRADALETVTGAAGVASSAEEIVARLSPPQAVGDAALVTRGRLVDVRATAMEGARDPQQNLPIRATDRLGQLRVPVRLVTITNESRPDGVPAAVAHVLTAHIKDAELVETSSSWGGLFPTGEPQRAAALIAELAPHT